MDPNHCTFLRDSWSQITRAHEWSWTPVHAWDTVPHQWVLDQPFVHSAERVHFGVQNHQIRGPEMGTTNPLRMCSDFGHLVAKSLDPSMAAILCASIRFDWPFQRYT